MNWAGLREKLKGSLAGRLLLGAFSLVYGAAVMGRRLLYLMKVLPSKKLRSRVICIGNLTTGGTGKTPAVIYAAQTLRRRNLNVAIVSRGYGRARADAEVKVLLDDENTPASLCGDEPWMMHQALQGLGIPILVSPDRLKAGMRAQAFYHSKVILLDDGFQHFPLKRDLDIVLVNALDPFGGGSLLPLGDLREPLSALGRANLIVITHADRAPGERIEKLKMQLRSYNPKAPIIEAAHKSDFLFDLKHDKRYKLSHLQGLNVATFCAIAGAAAFETQVADLGAVVGQSWRFPDHHAYTPQELQAFENLRDGRPLVTTFKDIPHLPAGWQSLLKGDVYALGIKLDIVKGKNIWIDTLCEGLVPAGGVE